MIFIVENFQTDLIPVSKTSVQTTIGEFYGGVRSFSDNRLPLVITTNNSSAAAVALNRSVKTLGSV